MLSQLSPSWMDENFKGPWHFFGTCGKFYINVDQEEDKVKFILKYGDCIA